MARPLLTAHPLGLDGKNRIAPVFVQQSIAQAPQPGQLPGRGGPTLLALFGLHLNDGASQNNNGRPGAQAEGRLQVDQKGARLLRRPAARTGASVEFLPLFEPEPPLIPYDGIREVEMFHARLLWHPSADALAVKISGRRSSKSEGWERMAGSAVSAAARRLGKRSASPYRMLFPLTPASASVLRCA